MGLGRGFVLTLPALVAHHGVRLVAAADPRAAARESFASEFGGRAYVAIEELLGDTAVEAVYIASPHEWHHAHAIAAAHAGKHVLVEKPMALGIDECQAMALAAQSSGTVLIVGPSHGFDEPVSLATRLIESGTYGRIRLINAMNYTDFVYRPRRAEELSREGGGVLFSQGAHQVDVVRRLAGARPVSARAVSGDWDGLRPMDGAYMAMMTFDNGAAASLTYSGYGRFDSDELQGWISELGYPVGDRVYAAARRRTMVYAAGDEESAKLARAYGGGAEAAVAASAPPFHEHFGWVLASCEKADLRLTPEGVHIYGEERHEFVKLDPPRIARQAVIDELVRAVRGDTPPVHDGFWGATTMACCTAIARSSRENREIPIDSFGATDQQ